MKYKRWFLAAVVLLGLMENSAHAATTADQTPSFAIQEHCVSWVRGCVAPTYKLLSESAKYNGVFVQYDGFASWSGRGLAIYPTLEAACHSLNGVGILLDESLVSEDIRQYLSANGVARLLVSAVLEVSIEGALGSMLGILRNQSSESAAHLSDMTHNLLIDPVLVKGRVVEGVHYAKISPPSCDI